MEQAIASVPITEKNLREYLSNAQAFIDLARWRVAITQGSGSYVMSGQTQVKEVSLTKLVQTIDSEDELYTTTELHVLRAIRRGIQIGYHVENDYRKRSGVYNIDSTVDLHDDQLKEFNEKTQTAAAIVQFVAMRHVLFELNNLISNNTFTKTLSVSVDEVNASQPTRSLQCMMYHLGKNVERSMDGSDDKLVAIVYRYAEELQQEILNRAGSLKYVEFFADVTYQLEESDFVVSGFERIEATIEVVDINETYPEDIIGNTSVSDDAVNLLRKLFLYIPEIKMNPIADFGGFQELQLLNGNPGNGKSMILAMIMTLARDYGEASGKPYQILVVPNLVSKMQGESRTWAENYFRKLFNPNSINIGIADELEASFPDHGGENVSEGDKAVTVEALKKFSGVSTQQLYNFIFFGATNYPENVDRAFMSRFKDKHPIVGAETVDDYVRFIVLNLRKLNSQYRGLINLEGVDWDMDIRAPQIANKETIIIDPTMSVPEIREEALKGYSQNHVYFFARFFFMMKLRQKMFSLRDCANIVGGAKSHVVGFTVPLDLITERKQYIEKPPEAQIEIIADMAREHVKTSGIDFAEMLNQKAMYYAEESLRMAETRRQRAVAAMTERKMVEYLSDIEFRKQLRKEV